MLTIFKGPASLLAISLLAGCGHTSTACEPLTPVPEQLTRPLPRLVEPTSADSLDVLENHLENMKRVGHIVTQCDALIQATHDRQKTDP